jgi:hypothetical protein
LPTALLYTRCKILLARRLPPLNALKAFEAAARLSSFAAALLNVTHAAISRHVRAKAMQVLNSVLCNHPDCKRTSLKDTRRLARRDARKRPPLANQMSVNRSFDYSQIPASFDIE